MSTLANSSGYMLGVVGEDKTRYGGKSIGVAAIDQIRLFSGLSLVLNKEGL